MDGVEIINIIYEYERLIHPFWSLGFGIICFVIAIIGMCTVYYDTIQRILIKIIIPFILAMIICIIGALIKTDKVSEVKYEIIITDNISIDEFASHYEIVGQNGERFLVKER